MVETTKFQKDDKVQRVVDGKPLTVECLFLSQENGPLYFCRSKYGTGHWFHESEIREGNDTPPSFLADL